jgi:hypothetical protein
MKRAAKRKKLNKKKRDRAKWRLLGDHLERFRDSLESLDRKLTEANARFSG